MCNIVPVFVIWLYCCSCFHFMQFLLWLCCRIFSVLSAILYLGNVTYRRKSTGRDEGLDVGPPEVLATLSDLLKVTCLCFCMTPYFTVCGELPVYVSINLCGLPLRLKRSCWLRRWRREKRWQSTTSWSSPTATLRYAPAMKTPLRLGITKMASNCALTYVCFFLMPFCFFINTTPTVDLILSCQCEMLYYILLFLC